MTNGLENGNGVIHSELENGNGNGVTRAEPPLARSEELKEVGLPHCKSRVYH
jgi:hypothetical protein